MGNHNSNETSNLEIAREFLLTHPNERARQDTRPGQEGILESILVLNAGGRINQLAYTPFNTANILARIPLPTFPPLITPSESSSIIPGSKYDLEGLLNTPPSAVLPVKTEEEHDNQSSNWGARAGAESLLQLAKDAQIVAKTRPEASISFIVDVVTNSESIRDSYAAHENHPKFVNHAGAEKSVPDSEIMPRLGKLANEASIWERFNHLISAGLAAITEQVDLEAYLTVEEVHMYRLSVLQPNQILENSVQAGSEILYKRNFHRFRAKCHPHKPNGKAYDIFRTLCRQESELAHEKFNAVEEHARQVQAFKAAMVHRSKGTMTLFPKLSDPTKLVDWKSKDLNVPQGKEVIAASADQVETLLSMDFAEKTQLMRDVPSDNDKLSQPAMTPYEVIWRMREQTERSGISPATYFSTVLGAPSSNEFVLSSTPPMNHPKKRKHLHPPFYGPLSDRNSMIGAESFDPDDTEEKESDQAILSPSSCDSKDGFDMPSAEKKQKQVQPQYNGPQPWMLDNKRRDAAAIAAIAAKSNRTDDMGDLMVRSRAGPVPKNVDTPSRKRKASIADLDIPGPRSAKRTKTLWLSKDSADSHLRGGSVVVEEFKSKDRSAEFQRLKAERKMRDDEEMFQGLRGFGGRQRGWNGERETDRQNTLNEYQLQEERKFLEANHKKSVDNGATKATPKYKEPATPRQRFSEPSHNTLSMEQKIQAMGRHLEDGYKMLSDEAKKIEHDFDARMEENTRLTKAQMIVRPWDLYAIKAEALAEQQAKCRPNLIIKLKLSRTAKSDGLNELAREDEEMSDVEHCAEKDDEYRPKGAKIYTLEQFANPVVLDLKNRHPAEGTPASKKLNALPTIILEKTRSEAARRAERRGEEAGNGPPKQAKTSTPERTLSPVTAELIKSSPAEGTPDSKRLNARPPVVRGRTRSSAACGA